MIIKYYTKIILLISLILFVGFISQLYIKDNFSLTIPKKTSSTGSGLKTHEFGFIVDKKSIIFDIRDSQEDKGKVKGKVKGKTIYYSDKTKSDKPSWKPITGVVTKSDIKSKIVYDTFLIDSNAAKNYYTIIIYTKTANTVYYSIIKSTLTDSKKNTYKMIGEEQKINTKITDINKIKILYHNKLQLFDTSNLKMTNLLTKSETYDFKGLFINAEYDIKKQNLYILSYLGDKIYLTHHHLNPKSKKEKLLILTEGKKPYNSDNYIIRIIHKDGEDKSQTSGENKSKDLLIIFNGKSIDIFDLNDSSPLRPKNTSANDNRPLLEVKTDKIKYMSRELNTTLSEISYLH